MSNPTADCDTLYYDASCGVCSAGVRRSRRILSRRGVVPEPFQSPGVAQMLGLRDNEVPDEIKLRMTDGRILGGADAMVYVCRRIWWAWPVWLVSRLPGVMAVLRMLYRRFARNRYRLSRVCSLPPETAPVPPPTTR